MLYLRMLTMIIIFVGYALLLHKKTGLQYEFAPALTVCGISVVMFFAGILNIFILTFWVITLGGIGSFVYCLLQKEIRQSVPRRGWFILGLWVAVVFYFSILIQGTHFISYDNFSHWGTVIKSMLLHDRMPNFQDDVIMFQAYPLGSSVFIYYICKLVGETDACFILGQTLLSISFLLPLFVFIRKQTWTNSLIVVLFSIYTLTCNINIYDLLVDTVMPLAGVALIAMLKYEYTQKTENWIKRIYIETFLFSVFLIQVKNSGIFFCLIAWIYFFVLNKQAERIQSNRIINSLKFTLFDILIPIFTSYLWKQHVALVYSSGNTSKHAMSVKNYENVFSEKTPTDIAIIGKNILAQLTNIHSESFYPMVSILLLFLILILLFWIEKKNDQIIIVCKQLVSIGAIFVLYVFSVFLMYVFSMPLSEAVTLESYSRYMLSLDIFVLGIAVVFVLYDISKYENKWPVVFLVILFLVPVIPIKERVWGLIKKPDYAVTMRSQLQDFIADKGILPEKKYLIYNNNLDNDSDYMYFVARYELWSSNIAIVSKDNLAEYLDTWNTYDYIIIFSPDNYSDDWLRKTGHPEYANGKRCVIQNN